MTTKIHSKPADTPEIDLSQYDIHEGSGIEFSITLKNAAEPDKVHVVYARDQKPGSDWEPFRFKFTHGNVRFKTLFVHKDELPFCEAYKNAVNRPVPQKGEGLKGSQGFLREYFYERLEALFPRGEEAHLLNKSLEIFMPPLERSEQMFKKNFEHSEMRLFMDSRKKK